MTISILLLLLMVLMIVAFFFFALLIFMFTSMSRMDPEPRKEIIRTANNNTFYVMAGYLLLCVGERLISSMRQEAIVGNNPFWQLALLVLVYLVQLIYYTKKYEKTNRL